MGKLGSAVALAFLATGRALPALLWNLVGLAGATAIAYGAFMIFEPAGFIVGGVLLVAGAAILAPRA